MTPQELLIPRIKLILKYPGCIVPVGTIFIQRFCYDTPFGFHMTFKQMSEFPEHFQLLEWWEDRDVADFPDYFSHEQYGGVKKLYKNTERQLTSTNQTDWYQTWYCKGMVPATQKQYDQYQSSISNTETP